MPVRIYPDILPTRFGDFAVGKFLLSLPDDRLEALRAVSSQTGIPVSHLIRSAIDSCFRCETAPTSGSCRVLASGITVVFGG